MVNAAAGYVDMIQSNGRKLRSNDTGLVVWPSGGSGCIISAGTTLEGQKDGPDMSRSSFLTTALEAAAAAAEIIRRYYQQNLKITIKADKSPVTEADVEAERVIRAILIGRFPDHGFYGEETGTSAMDAEYVWIVDPIDGTKAFIREYPMFSTQIALMHRGRLIVGVSSAPAYGELAYGEIGVGAWLNDERIEVSGVDTLESAALSTGNLKTLATGPRWPAVGRMIGRLSRIRGYGDFLHYHLLASGRIDAVIESDVNILDVGACAVIVEAAGGRFTDLGGQPLTLESSSVLATNGPLHATILAALGP
jgi:histidinol-phosphatase